MLASIGRTKIERADSRLTNMKTIMGKREWNCGWSKLKRDRRVDDRFRNVQAEVMSKESSLEVGSPDGQICSVVGLADKHKVVVNARA